MRARGIADLRARTHRLMPRFVLEYLEGGAEDEATRARARDAFADWRFVPRTLLDVSARTPATTILGRPAPLPIIVAPTGLNGVFQLGADVALATGAAKAGMPFVQSTMSNDPIEAVAAVPGLRHWFQLYVFGEDAIWQTLVDRAAAADCEALVLTSNSQIFGNREWDARTRASETRPSLSTIIDAALHPRWLERTLRRGMPRFVNVTDFVPADRRGFFHSAFWIREQMPKSLSWDPLAKIRARWTGPLLLKGMLNLADVNLALAAGVDGVVLSSHGGRQMDGAAPETVATAADLARAAAVLNAGEKVAILVGAGARDAVDHVIAVADRFGAGCAKPLLGKQVLPDALPWVTGSIGMLGNSPSHEMMTARDTLLMGGTGFPYAEFLPEEGTARAVQIDLDPAMLSIRYPCEVNLEGDARLMLTALLPLLGQKTGTMWRDQLAG